MLVSILFKTNSGTVTVPISACPPQADLSLGLRGRIGSLMLQFCAEREAGPREGQSLELHAGQALGSGCVPSLPARPGFFWVCFHFSFLALPE